MLMQNFLRIKILLPNVKILTSVFPFGESLEEVSFRCVCTTYANMEAPSTAAERALTQTWTVGSGKVVCLFLTVLVGD